MDPASVVTLITFAAQTSSLIGQALQSLYPAPHEILALRNELSDLNAVLVEFQSLQAKTWHLDWSTQGPGSFRSTFAGCIAKLERLFDDLAQEAATLFTRRSDGRCRLERHTWLRKKSKITRLKTDLATVRQNLHDLIGIFTAHQVTRIDLRLESLRTLLEPTQASLPSSGDALGSVLDRLSQRHHESPAPHSQSHSTTESISVGQVASTVTVNAYTRPACNLRCACACHIRRRARNPSFVDSFLGVLFIGYTGLPALGSSCDFQSCRNSSVRAIQITYAFPTWFIQRSVDLVLGLNYFGEPEMNIKIRNRIDYTAEHNMFQLARQGKVEEMKSLLGKRPKSLNDVTVAGGRSPFDVSISIF